MRSILKLKYYETPCNVKKIQTGDLLRDSKLSNAKDFLQIRFGYLKLTSATPGLSNTPKLRFKSNIAGIFVTDIYRIVGDTKGCRAENKPGISVSAIWNTAILTNRLNGVWITPSFWR